MPDVGKTTITTPTDLEVQSTRIFAAPRPLVWRAWTEPAHVQRWMTGPDGWTMPVCEMDFRVGGRYRFVWRKADGKEMPISGVYTAISAPERFSYTDRWGAEWPETLNTVWLREQNGHTVSTVTVRYQNQKDRDAALATGMKDGFEVADRRLAEYLPTMV